MREREREKRPVMVAVRSGEVWWWRKAAKEIEGTVVVGGAPVGGAIGF